MNTHVKQIYTAAKIAGVVLTIAAIKTNRLLRRIGSQEPFAGVSIQIRWNLCNTQMKHPTTVRYLAN